MMYHDRTELTKALVGRIDELPAEDLSSDKEIKYLLSLQTIYTDALKEAEKCGWIGVGCITYAENRLQEAQKLNLVDEGDN